MNQDYIEMQQWCAYTIDNHFTYNTPENPYTSCLIIYSMKDILISHPIFIIFRLNVIRKFQQKRFTRERAFLRRSQSTLREKGVFYNHRPTDCNSDDCGKCAMKCPSRIVVEFRKCSPYNYYNILIII